MELLFFIPGGHPMENLLTKDVILFLLYVRYNLNVLLVFLIKALDQLKIVKVITLFIKSTASKDQPGGIFFDFI